MTTNLSKKKREKLIKALEIMKDKYMEDLPMLNTIIDIENALTKTKYGLIFEEHEERVDVELKSKIPVFVEEKSKEIKLDSNKPINFLLEGDNLHSLKLLEKTHKGAIDVIYIDPPYNTKNKDFIYDDTIVDMEDGFRHSKWLSFMNNRLRIAREILSKKGIIFISIDENEQAQLKMLCDSIFGEKNFIECIVWNKRVPKNDKGIGNIHEYILVYCKNTDFKYKFMMEKDGLDEIYALVDNSKKKKVPLEEAEKQLKQFYKKKAYDRAITLYNAIDDNYRIWGKINLSWPNGNTFGPRYDVLHPITKKAVKVPDRGWRWSETTFNNYLDYDNIIQRYDGSIICGSIWFAKDENTQPSLVKYIDEVDRMLLRSILSTKSDGSIELEKYFGKKSVFAYPKPVSLIKNLIDSITYDNKNAIILDFFAGSGTTGQSVIELNEEDGGNRSFILCTNNENNICENVTYERLYKVINGFNSSKGENIEGIKANLKYYKTNYIDRFINDEYSDIREELKPYIEPLIQLENGVDIISEKIIVILTDEDAKRLITSENLLKAEKIYIGSDVLMSGEQESLISQSGVVIIEIPEYYFSQELWESEIDD